MSNSTTADEGGVGSLGGQGLRAGVIVVTIFLAGALVAALPAAEPPVAGRNHTLPDLKLEMLWVEAGTFLMGSPPDEEGRDRSEGPQTRVTLSRGFWLGRTELTQGQYQALTGTNPSRFTAVGPEAPVERVSWLEATELCRQLTERERAAGRLPAGYVYRLPTEAQWEYACRAGTTGPTAGELNAMAWHEHNSDETTHPVARLSPNRWGFFDMSGNVLEWCHDWYGSYPGGSVVDPAGPSSGHFRMARGGSWRTRPDVGRSAARAGGSPGRQDYTIGLRLALVPGP